MPRNLSAAQLIELNKTTIIFSYLISLESSATTRFYHTGPDNYSYLGNNYIADGNVLSISDFEENTGLSFNTQRLILSGANISNYQILLTEQLTNRKCEILLLLNNAEVIPLITQRIQSINIVDDDLVIELESQWQNYNYPQGRTNTIESQQRFFPNDFGFSFSADLEDKKLQWGGDS